MKSDKCTKEISERTYLMLRKVFVRILPCSQLFVIDETSRLPNKRNLLNEIFLHHRLTGKVPSQAHLLTTTIQPTMSKPSPTISRLSTPENANVSCSCGKGDGTGDYILCDNNACPLGWYHWECVQVTEPPVGTWLCPKCCPNAEFYVKQLVKPRAAPPVASRKIEKRAEASGSKSKEQEPQVEKRKGEVAKKGTAVKKPAQSKPQPKPKPRWLGWQEMSSDGEEEFKKNVDAQWRVEDVSGQKRRRVPKVVFEEDEAGSSRLSSHSRAQRKRRVIVTSSEEEGDDDDEARVQQRPEDADSEGVVYQEKEEEEEEDDITDNDDDDDEDDNDDDKEQDDDEEEEQGNSSKNFDSSEDDTMDWESEPPISGDGSPSKLSPRDSEVARQISHQLGQLDQNLEDRASQGGVEDSEDSMEIDSHHEIRDSDASDGSRYIDGDEDDASTSETASPAVSPVSEGSESADEREDGMDVDAGDEGQTPVAARYQRQGNCWGNVPDSAIRSTLPRLA